MVSTMIRILLSACLLFSSTLTLAWAHGERPRALHIEFSPSSPDTIWVLSHTQGTFANLKTGFSWVCEDSVYAGAPTAGLAVSGERGGRWVVATGAGLFVSTDRGCNFHRGDGVVGAHALAGLWFHGEAAEYLTASRTSMARNDVFISPDQGETWSPLGLDIAGAIKSVHWAASDPLRLYVHHRYGVHRSDDLGRTLSPITVGADAVEIPPELIRMLAVSPTDADLLIVIVDVGERSRILRSDDGGRTWVDTTLIDSRELSAVMHPDGQKVLVVNPFGDAWRSKDAGATWEAGESVPMALGCLRIKPGTQTLYACSDPDVDGPWVAGRSDDFGESWSPVFEDFETASHRDDCAAASKSTVCCRGLCPGDQTAEMCGQPDVGALPELCEPAAPAPLPLIDGGAPTGDAGRDPGTSTLDQGVFEDSMSSPSSDIGPRAPDRGSFRPDGDVQRPGDSHGGCQSVSASWPYAWIFGILLLGRLRRKKRHEP